jgi:hypothetical protein
MVRVVWGAVASVALATGAVKAVNAQTIALERGRTIVVGGSTARSRTERVDSARTGMARSRLPTSALHVEWTLPIAALVEQAPVVDAHGSVYVVGSRGEVFAIAADGSERWHLATGGIQAGPPVLLSDDTLVFADGAGEAVAVRDGRIRFRTRFGRSNPQHPAPLALDDGGVVVGTSRDLSVLDADGHERARTTLPEETTAPLVSALGMVVAVSASGTVWTWKPGATEPVLVATFGSALDGCAALADERTLVAITDGETHMTAVDLRAGSASTRAVSLGTLWLGPAAVLNGKTFLLSLGSTSLVALALERSGRERARTLIAARTPPAAPPDGGVPALAPEPHVPPLIDAAETLVFATAEGRVGAVAHAGDGTGSVELVSTPCAATPAGGARVAPALTGLAPLRPDAFVAACGSGTVFAVSGSAGSGGRKPP